MYEQNQVTIKKDHGYIVLYNRNNSPNWQTRIKLQGAKDIKKSCRTNSKKDAHIFADKLYYQLVDKYQTTGTTTTKSYQDVFKECLLELEQTDEPQLKIIDFKEHIERHSLQYWNSTSIDLITDKEIENYITWRRKKYTGLKDSTLIRGFVPIKKLFKLAYKKGYIKKIPDFPKLENKSEPRPDFDENEWQKITNKVNDWIKIAPKNQVRSRTYLKYYILIVGNTGIRSGTEARSITWNSLDEIPFKGQRKKQMIIWINEGKTKQRRTVPLPIVRKFINELMEFRMKECEHLNIPFNKDEPIFCNKKGVGIKSFKKGYKTFLKNYNLHSNKNNEFRTLYSLRHTYATRMNRQNINLRNLSQNMGTSLKMLEKTYLHDDIEDFGAEFLQASAPNYIPSLFPI